MEIDASIDRSAMMVGGFWQKPSLPLMQGGRNAGDSGVMDC
jgi:hypothetical protein